MNAGRAIEALLIMATEPLAAADLAAQLGLPERDVTAELEQLSRFYQDTSRGFELRRVAGGWRLATAPDLAETLEAAVVAETRARLSQAALETLAVIAYRQPISRTRIARIRGVNVDGVVRTLLARGLVEETGATPSGARLYGTTGEFLEKMGMTSLSELVPLAPYLPSADALDELEEEL